MKQEFIEKLKVRLQQPLPGARAQNIMRARRSSGQQISFTHKGLPRQGAVAFVLYQQLDRWYFPLIKRTEYPGIHSGQISLPGGKKERGDLDLTETAIRETNEELGLNLSPDHAIGTLSELYIVASHFNILPVVAVLGGPPKIIPDPREVQEVVMIPLDQLLLPELRKERDLLVRGYDIRAPYYDLNNQVVWGATAMILSEFLTIVKEIEYH